jgi:hypothetical protein
MVPSPFPRRVVIGALLTAAVEGLEAGSAEPSIEIRHETMGYELKTAGWPS